jgi:hypothetical protein
MDKSFLLLFFKKEALPFAFLQPFGTALCQNSHLCSMLKSPAEISNDRGVVAEKIVNPGALKAGHPGLPSCINLTQAVTSRCDKSRCAGLS